MNHDLSCPLRSLRSLRLLTLPPFRDFSCLFVAKIQLSALSFQPLANKPLPFSFVSAAAQRAPIIGHPCAGAPSGPQVSGFRFQDSALHLAPSSQLSRNIFERSTPGPVLLLVQRLRC
jgi:hypothetical protein